MYLTNIVLENVGPIEEVSLDAQFNEDGTPKPIIIVGANGSGKTMFLSSIADSLYLFGAQAFSDVAKPNPEGGTYYFRVNGNINQRTGAQYSYTLIKFRGFNDNNLYYHEKTGELDSTQIAAKHSNFAPIIGWSSSGNSKMATQDKEQIEADFNSCVYAFFSANRYEIPHWMNSRAGYHDFRHEEESGFSGEINRPIYVESSLEKNKSWLLDVFLDSMVKVFVEEGSLKVSDGEMQRTHFAGQLSKSRENVESVVKILFNNPKAEFYLNNRSFTSHRLGVIGQNEIIVPSLNSMSSGETAIFNLFVTILRYADKINLYNTDTRSISGIVIIDEFDLHVNSKSIYAILPKIMLMFPKIQFLLSTHSPLFILGLQKEIGEEHMQIIELPSGMTITPERYSDFQQSFDYMRETERYILEMGRVLHESKKPIILMEGETDPNYLKHYLKIIGRDDLLEKLEIRHVGMKQDKKSIGTGMSGLNEVVKVITNNPTLSSRKVCLIYDCDAPNKEAKLESYHLRIITRNPNNVKVINGIENLFEASVVSDNFYDIKEEPLSDGGSKTVKNLNKVKLCRHLCTIDDVSVFENFKELEKFLDEFIS